MNVHHKCIIRLVKLTVYRRFTLHVAYSQRVTGLSLRCAGGEQSGENSHINNNLSIFKDRLYRVVISYLQDQHLKGDADLHLQGKQRSTEELQPVHQHWWLWRGRDGSWGHLQNSRLTCLSMLQSPGVSADIGCYAFFLGFSKTVKKWSSDHSHTTTTHVYIHAYKTSPLTANALKMES